MSRRNIIILNMPVKPRVPLIPVDAHNEPIGTRIARIRRNRGFTQGDIAKMIGISRASVANYEQGRVHIYDEMVIRFAIALNITADEILGLKPSENHSETNSPKVSRRMKQIATLPESDQRHILRTLDSLIKAAEINNEKICE